MSYALRIGLKYLRSKKRSTVSLITMVAVTGVALGVAALLAVLSITSGFQDEFRNKVLGVNSHVLVLKYGLDFEEYRDVIEHARDIPEVAGAAPFLINEMMLAKGDRISGVLVKGVDPESMETVLDLPHQIVDGSLEGMRRPGALPQVLVDDLADVPDGADDLDAFLLDLARDADDGATNDRGDAAGDRQPSPGVADTPDGDGSRGTTDDLIERAARGEPLVDGADGTAGRTADSDRDRVPTAVDDGSPGGGLAGGHDGEGDGAAGDEEEAESQVVDALPDVAVPTPEEVEALLEQLEQEGLPSDEAEQQIFVEEELELIGAGEDSEELPGIVVGATLASNLGIGVGDRVKVISPLAGLDISMWSPEARTPRSRDFRVIAIFEAGFQEYDSRLVYVDLYEAQPFYDQGDTVTGVEIRLHDLEQAPNIARRLERELGGGPFHTMDWQELNHNLFTALEIQKVMLSLVIATIILVAAFNVIATLIMIVLEKKREIAILKAMGAKDRSVLTIFLVQGTVIGLVGTAIGLVLGGAVVSYLAAYEFPLDPKVYLIDHLPVRVSPMEFVVTVAVALLICVTATLIPSWWAARLLPADGVRYE